MFVELMTYLNCSYYDIARFVSVFVFLVRAVKPDEQVIHTYSKIHFDEDPQRSIDTDIIYTYIIEVLRII